MKREEERKGEKREEEKKKNAYISAKRSSSCVPTIFSVLRGKKTFLLR